MSEKKLSELLARDLLFPVAHGVTYDEIRAISPPLGSRNGFSTDADSMEDIAKKIAELVALSSNLGASVESGSTLPVGDPPCAKIVGGHRVSAIEPCEKRATGHCK